MDTLILPGIVQIMPCVELVGLFQRTLTYPQSHGKPWRGDKDVISRTDEKIYADNLERKRSASQVPAMKRELKADQT